MLVIDAQTVAKALRDIIKYRDDYFDTKNGIEIRRVYPEKGDGENIVVRIGQPPGKMTKVFQSYALNEDKFEVSYQRLYSPDGGFALWAIYVVETADKIRGQVAKRKQADALKKSLEEREKSEEKENNEKPFDDSAFFKPFIKERGTKPLTHAEKKRLKQERQANLAEKREQANAARKVALDEEAIAIAEAIVWQKNEEAKKAEAEQAAAEAKARAIAEAEAKIINFPTQKPPKKGDS